MPSKSLFERYNELPAWRRTLLLPIAIPLYLLGMLSGCFALVFLFVFLIPICSVRWAWLEIRFRRRMRKSGRIIRWEQAISGLEDHDETMLVVVGFKGVQRMWLIPDRPESVVRDNELISVYAYTSEGLSVFNQYSDDKWKQLECWAVKHLARYEGSAKLVKAKPTELRKLPERLKRSSAFITHGLYGGLLSH
jgi:hypothetical protein